jgi:hypothetical protein
MINNKLSTKKEKLIHAATLMAADFSHVREQARLKLKVIRKKQLLLKEVLKEDAQRLSNILDTECKDLSQKPPVSAFFQMTLQSLIDELSLPFDADIEKVRHTLLSQTISILHEPILAPLRNAEPLQESEALCGLFQVFGGAEGLERIQKSEDPYGEITKVITPLYRQRPRSCTALFTKDLENQAKQKKDPLLHPIPSQEAISNALRRIRVGTHESIPDVSVDIEPTPIRPGLRPVPPDLMVKALIGTDIKDQNRAKKFCQRLKAEAVKAQALQKEQGATFDVIQQRTLALKNRFLHFIDPSFLSPTSVPLQPITTLIQTLTHSALAQRARQLELYLNTYQLYTRLR